MLSILETLGCRVEARGRDVVLDASRAENHEMPEKLSKRLRSSIFMLGPLVARFGRARVSYPGGCEIGQRPIDLHLKGLRALGVQIRETHGMIECDGARLRGADVYLDFPSVGAKMCIRDRPTTQVRRPAFLKISPRRVEVVVLPLVPVTASRSPVDSR